MTEALIAVSFWAMILSSVCMTVHMLIQLTFECKCAFTVITFELAILVGVGICMIQELGKIFHSLCIVVFYGIA